MSRGREHVGGKTAFPTALRCYGNLCRCLLWKEYPAHPQLPELWKPRCRMCFRVGRSKEMLLGVPAVLLLCRISPVTVVEDQILDRFHPGLTLPRYTDTFKILFAQRIEADTIKLTGSFFSLILSLTSYNLRKCQTHWSVLNKTNRRIKVQSWGIPTGIMKNGSKVRQWDPTSLFTESVNPLLGIRYEYLGNWTTPVLPVTKQHLGGVFFIFQLSFKITAGCICPPWKNSSCSLPAA